MSVLSKRRVEPVASLIQTQTNISRMNVLVVGILKRAKATSYLTGYSRLFTK
jgi:hypothetical protein